MCQLYDHNMTFTIDFQGQIFQKAISLGIGGPLDRERKGYELIIHGHDNDLWVTTVDGHDMPLQWRHNECNGVSNYQCLHCFVYSPICSGTGLRKHQSSTSLAFVRGIHRLPTPVARKMFPFDDVIMTFVTWLDN